MPSACGVAPHYGMPSPSMPAQPSRAVGVGRTRTFAYGDLQDAAGRLAVWF
jgi:hypothetical protein